MNTIVTPVWGALDPNVRAVWVATGESPEWIAARVDDLLSQLQSVFDISEWELTNGQLWTGPLTALAEIVRSNPVRELLGGSEEIGGALPSDGYSFVISGASSRVAVRVWIAAGHPALGLRLPRRRLNIELREVAAGALTSRDGDAACQAVAKSWQPGMLVLSDDPVRQLAPRGNWKVGVGYRTWIDAKVGTVVQIAKGLIANELEGGTMISAPDDWSAEQVVQAMLSTLEANGLDEVPH